MARDGNERGGLTGFLDRLLGRRPEDRTPASKPMFTAHQPPPAARAEPEAARDDAAAEAPQEAPEPESLDQAPVAAPTDLFRSSRRFPRDAWEEEDVRRAAEPEPEPVAGPEPDDGSLRTAVHADAIEQAPRRARNAPDVRVHDRHLEERSRPVELTPSQALELARGGRDTLKPRDRD